jgi:gliding motility-associated lipoprotein GldH
MSAQKLIGALLIFFMVSCEETGLYEKVVFMPGHEWAYANKPSFSFEIKDTSSSYQVYFLIRHSDAYEYNNIWITLNSQMPGDSVQQYQKFEIPLATSNRWLGSGMDDIYDHRVLLYREPVKFRKPGAYTISIAQDMRVDPLKQVFNVGLRLEKIK